MDGAAVSSEVVGSGAALAGLILVYIGMQVTTFSSYQAQEQKAVKLKLLGRAWVAFVGLFLALGAAALAVVGKWMPNACVSNLSVWILLAAFAWTAFTAIRTIHEIS